MSSENAGHMGFVAEASGLRDFREGPVGVHQFPPCVGETQSSDVSVRRLSQMPAERSRQRNRMNLDSTSQPSDSDAFGVVRTDDTQSAGNPLRMRYGTGLQASAAGGEQTHKGFDRGLRTRVGVLQFAFQFP